MRRLPLSLVLVVVADIGLFLWFAMFYVTYGDDKPHDLLIHLGEVGATLAVLSVLGGLVQVAFADHKKRQQEEEAERDYYRNVLADFKSVYDQVESCRLLVEAHQSAKTYGEQIRGLVDAVVTLHNIKRSLDPGFPTLKFKLKTPINAMTKFIKGLLTEFRENYRRISILQAADEAWNKYSRENLPKEERPPEEYKPLSRAWAEIQDLPKLAVLREDRQFKEYESQFLEHLDHASEILRGRLPVTERQTDSKR